jgi:hypothetical protein
MKRPRRSPKPRSPYPHRGSPAGDAVIGTCDGAGCERTLHRGDIFFTMLDSHLYCIDCYEQMPCISIAEDRATPAQEQAVIEANALVWDGDFPE